MKTCISLLLITLTAVNLGFSQTKNIAKKLGYPTDAKLLIIHADDLGVAHSENWASIKALEGSPVNSASIMVPCPWFPEIASYAQAHPDMDFGLHLTLNAEWKNYKWGPVASKDSVQSLVNDAGYFYDNVPEMVQKAKPNEVAHELEQQIKKALKAGINVTHLDAHMGAAMSTPEFLEAYIKLGQKYKLPVLLDYGIEAMDNKVIGKLLRNNDVVVDRTMTALPNNFDKGFDAFYTNLLKNLEPGLNCLLIHLAYDDTEMQAITIDHPDWGAAWRQADFDFFTSETSKEILKKNNIILVSWKEIRDKIVRAK
jgi:predicted glycoside hydrolase/deacetylase ChbG (UPF0249 family)